MQDEQGKPIRESNARIVKWSDGTYQLLIGEDNVFDLRIENNTDNSQFVASVEVHSCLTLVIIRKLEMMKLSTKVISLHSCFYE